MKRKKVSNSVERRLRKIIREELTRQYLVQEGLLDSIKKPFQKLSEKAKQVVSQKVDEVLEKISAAIEGVKKPEGLDEFIKKFERTEGGMDIKELATEVGLEDVISTLENKNEMKEGLFIVSRESLMFAPVSVEDLTSSFALIEGYYRNRAIKTQEVLKEERLTEVVGLATIAGAWWATIKTIIGVLGGASLGCKLLAAIFEKVFNKPDIAKKLKHYEHVFHELEEKALRVLAYPAPVAYAAYIAASDLKGIIQKGKAKKLSYDEFNSPEHKEEKVAAEKLIHTALLFAIIVEAITHIGHAVKELAQNTSHALESIGHSAAEISKEAPALSKTARGAATAGAQIA
jgi:hypothetical protein